jgi:(4S)-4-hydroxy-5-phosphonooxypentane-2,3-dione isomerase
MARNPGIFNSTFFEDVPVIVNVVTVHVKPEHITEFMAATVANHTGTRTEPGNHRFDMLQSQADPGQFLLYEVFASPEAVDAHRKTPHYQIWRALVEGWMAKPRELVSHRIIAPVDPSAW